MAVREHTQYLHENGYFCFVNIQSNFFYFVYGVAIYQVWSRRGIKKGVNTGGDSPWMKSASRPNIRKFRLTKTAVTTPR